MLWLRSTCRPRYCVHLSLFIGYYKHSLFSVVVLLVGLLNNFAVLLCTCKLPVSTNLTSTLSYLWVTAPLNVGLLVIIGLWCSLYVCAYLSPRPPIILQLILIFTIMLVFSWVEQFSDLFTNWDLTLKGQNTLLQNKINLTHPPLLYLTAALFLIAAFTDCVGVITLYLVILSQGAYTLYLGAWWAYQEGTWGGWWGWDASESLLVLLFLGIIAGLHLSPSITYSQVDQNPANRIPPLTLVIMYLTLQLNLTSSLHDFLTTSPVEFIQTPLPPQLLLCSLLFLGQAAGRAATLPLLPTPSITYSLYYLLPSIRFIVIFGIFMALHLDYLNAFYMFLVQGTEFYFYNSSHTGSVSLLFVTYSLYYLLPVGQTSPYLITTLAHGLALGVFSLTEVSSLFLGSVGGINLENVTAQPNFTFSEEVWAASGAMSPSAALLHRLVVEGLRSQACTISVMPWEVRTPPLTFNYFEWGKFF